KLWRRAQMLAAPAATPPTGVPGAPAPPARKDYPEEIRASLSDKPFLAAGWSLYGPDAERCVQAGPDGVRITLPAGYPGQRPGTGLVTKFGVKGDFEITLAFEIVGEPDASQSQKPTTLSLVVVP